MSKNKNIIELGDEVQDIVNGFQGIAISKLIHLNGCISFEVRPKVKPDKGYPDSYYIDQQQLKIIKKKVIKPILYPKSTETPYQEDDPGGSVIKAPSNKVQRG